MNNSKSADQLAKIVDRVNNGGQGSSGTGGQPQQQHSLNASSRAQIQGTRWEAMDNQIDQNLGSLLYFY
jgi:hypothetical protein